MLRLLLPLHLLVVALVVAAAVQAHPRPGFAGARLAVLLALIGFAIAVPGAILSRYRVLSARVAFLVLIVVSSAMLVGLQPSGSAFIGAFVAVSVAAIWVRGMLGAVIAGLALFALPLAQILSDQRSPVAIALLETGVLAFYVVAVLASRLHEGQEQAQQLLTELAQTRDAQAHAAVLAERQRLARDMHDVLAHSLSGLALQLEAGRLLAEHNGADAQIVETLERAHHLAKTGLDEARRAIGLLRDEELPGPERLPQLVAQFERDTAIPTSIKIGGDRRALDPDARLTVYRAAQEALTNVRKHARCARVELRLDYQPRGARLTVEDFGERRRGTGASDGRGYGLTGMRERAELLGGTLIACPTDAGFRVELWLPS
jgi:signal transduction histidine kinase